MHTEKWLTILFNFFLMITPVAGFAQVPNKDPLVCGVSDQFAPFQFKLKGQPAGLDVDWAMLLEKEMGRPILLKQGNWDDLIALLRFQRIDCLMGIEVNDIREKYLAFTDPLYFSESTVIALKSNRDVNTLADLRHKLVANDRHSKTETFLLREPAFDEIRIVNTENMQESLIRLKEGRVDAVIIPEQVGEYFAQKLGVEVKTIYRYPKKTPIAIAVHQSNQDLVRQIEKANAALLKQGALEELEKKWHVE